MCFFGSVEKTRVEEKVVFHARLAPVSRGVPQGRHRDRSTFPSDFSRSSLMGIAGDSSVKAVCVPYIGVESKNAEMQRRQVAGNHGLESRII
jgi:hypothetical protein